MTDIPDLIRQLSAIRFAGTDQNPGGIRDLIAAALEQQAREIETLRAIVIDARPLVAARGQLQSANLLQRIDAALAAGPQQEPKHGA